MKATTSLQFQGMTKTEFDADVNIKASIKTGVEAAVTGVTVDVNTIVATDGTSRRRLSSSADPEASNRRRLGTSDAVDVSFEAATEIGSSDASTAFNTMTTALSTNVANGAVSTQVNSAYTGTFQQTTAMRNAYTPPATFTASACHGTYTDDEPTNHFTADCSAASADGATCALTLTSGYEVSTRHGRAKTWSR